MTSFFQPKAAHFLKFLNHSFREGYANVMRSVESPKVRLLSGSGESSPKPKANENLWKRRYFVLTEGKLARYVDEEQSKAGTNGKVLLLADVISIRTKPSWGSNCFEVEWNEGKVLFQVKDKEERNLWLFSFQRSIAYILTQLLADDGPSRLGKSSEGEKMSPRASNRRRTSETPERLQHGSVGGNGIGAVDGFKHTAAARESPYMPGATSHHDSVSTILLEPPDRRDSMDSSDDLFMFDDLELRGGGNAESRDEVKQPPLLCKHGSASDIGCRSKMEDEIIYTNDLEGLCQSELGLDTSNVQIDGFKHWQDGSNYSCREIEKANPSSQCDNMSFFAVYDGHAGTYAAKFVCERLHKYIYWHPKFLDENLEACVKEAFLSLDEDLLRSQVQNKDYSGCTAAIALVRETTLCVAMLGDSRVILCRNGATEELLAAHSPGLESEKARIESVNGWVTKEKELLISRLRHMDLNDPFVKEKAQKQSFVQVYRVNGDLGVARAFGDPEFKENGLQNSPTTLWNWPKEHGKSFSGSLLTSTPDIRVTELLPSDDFIILACDGLWDVLTPTEAVNRVTKYFSEQGMTEDQASQKLVELAMKLGSSDNVSIIVVRFVHTSSLNNTV